MSGTTKNKSSPGVKPYLIASRRQQKPTRYLFIFEYSIDYGTTGIKRIERQHVASAANSTVVALRKIPKAMLCACSEQAISVRATTSQGLLKFMLCYRLFLWQNTRRKRATQTCRECSKLRDIISAWHKDVPYRLMHGGNEGCDETCSPGGNC